LRCVRADGGGAVRGVGEQAEREPEPRSVLRQRGGAAGARRGGAL